ncbi:hypothetical protein [Rhodanobacter sp. Root627]|uniref:pilus assembly protein n=1 Tax=Rhodanobacter sp. Root627 TaxID=1736572 RepID=UPI000ACA8FD0|nr:hypothetical protein [Rhodanobacter sp. Root627]
MTTFKNILRGLWLSLPIVIISGVALVGVSAQSTAPAVTPGRISTADMPDFESYPSGVNALAAPHVPPLVMLVMSRDEQLFNKAYPDYTDLDNDGKIDTTYNNAFIYNGYFDPDICYSYSSDSGTYSSSTKATTHQCSGNWSGNFLNWVAMSRLDIIRWVLYGGTRSIDTATSTVLERAEIPDDLHAWAKVYSGADINKYTPLTGTQTFCNVSTGNTGTTGGWNTPTQAISGIKSTPVIRVASGNWSDWASTAKLQCQWRSGNGNAEGDSARPSSGADYKARVTVCKNGAVQPNESYCVATGTSLKPEGLLQKYSKNGGSDIKRFGLVTGSVTNARKGGQLRRNIGKLASNAPTGTATGTGCEVGDEFNSKDGTFCYKKKTATEGIVMTLDRLQVFGWNGVDYGTSGSTACNAPGGNAWGGRGYDIQQNPAKCPDFGNPLAGMYATALQYIHGDITPTRETGSPLPTPAWVDPYGKLTDGSFRNKECAACSIVLISSGLNTFDAKNVPAVTLTGSSTLDATGLTDAIQNAEGISGSYMLSINALETTPTLTVADKTTSDTTFCAPASIGKLSNLVGICNGAPGQQGSYLLAGLSYGAWNADGSSAIRKMTDATLLKFQVKTYGVSLSDNLPSFNINVGNGKSVSLSPSCRADPNNGGNFATCYIGNVRVGAQKAYDGKGSTTYGLTPAGVYSNVGSFYLIWEDSQYGSDHDQDEANIISYCVGKSCNLPSTVVSGGVAICDPAVMNGTVLDSSRTIGDACDSNGKLKSPMPDGSTDVIIRNQLVAYSSAPMKIGYQISGTTKDGLVEFSVRNSEASQGTNDRNGSSFNCNLLGNASGNLGSGGCSSRPQITRFSVGTGTPVAMLQTPLWYASKYSGFKDDAPVLPTNHSDPENYFFARNAGALKEQLKAVFDSISSSAADNFGNATTPSSSNDVKGYGLSYQVQYYQQRNDVKWTGSLQAFWSDGSYLREGTTSGAQELESSAYYVTTGKNTASTLTDAMTSYRCAIPPAGQDFDPTQHTGDCSMVTEFNPLRPAWDAGKWLNAYYDPTAASDSAAAKAIANLAKQRTYGDATDLSGNSQRYIFTYLTGAPNGSTATGTVTTGSQTDFVWNAGSCDATTGKYTLSATSGFCGGIGTDGKRFGNYGLLNEKDPALAEKLVNWVRGVEYPKDYRSRTGTTLGDPKHVDENGADAPIAGTTYTYRLGDIVDSSPMIVGTPAESYDLLYSDFGYAAFRANYQSRRQMVYVGANDGMLHAFNGGFYIAGQAGPDPTNPTALRQLTSESGMTTGNASVKLGNNWQLGQEVWAFVPDNLVPHLRWLADKDYTHVFYVDGSPVVTDAQIFTSAAITGNSTACKAGTAGTADIDSKGHVCGWGTVMAVPFRLGGGPISVDTVGNGTAADIQASNSAYVILDVTDPEQPPTVLGEIVTGTFASAAPAFSVHREADGKLHFLLTVGSGPADNGGPNGDSGDKPVSAPYDTKLKVWVYDLADMVSSKSSTPVASLVDTGPANSFAGDMISTDFDLNFSSEGVYFGAVTNPDKSVEVKKATYTGGLWKLDMNTGGTADADGNATAADTSDPSTFKLVQVIGTDQPVTIRPTVALDPTGRPMLFFGTGRSYTTNDDDGASAQGTQQQYIYGVSDNSLISWLDADCKKMPTTDPLFDTTSVEVAAEDAEVSGLPTEGFDDVNTVDNLAAKLTSQDATTGCYNYSGWKLKLTAGNIDNQVPSERVVSSQTLYAGDLQTTTYLPASRQKKLDSGESQCRPIPVPGNSNLYAMNYLTGTADPALAGSFGTDASGNVNRKVGLGGGKASAPVLIVKDGQVTAAVGLSGGTKLQELGSVGGASNGEISWREPMDNQ